MAESRSQQDTQTLIAAEVGAFLSSPWIQASDEMSKGMMQMMAKADQLANTGVLFKQGNLFEYIEAAKFNAAAAAQGEDVRAVVTDAIGRPHDPVDILLQKSGETVREVQAKSYADPHDALEQLSNPKYDGMGKLVPVDKADDVNGLLGTHHGTGGGETIAGQLGYGDVTSGGTTFEEAHQAAGSPEHYAAGLESAHELSEVIHTGTSAMAAGAVIGGSISILKNYYAYRRGEICADEAGVSVLADTARRAVWGGSAGAMGAGIRNLSGGAMTPFASVAVSSALISTSAIALAYATGKMSAKQAAHQMGGVGVGCVSGIYGRAALGALIGSGGAVVGSIAGYTIARLCYEGATSLYRDVKLAEEESRRLKRLCLEASEQMRLVRLEIKNYVDALKRKRGKDYSDLTQLLDSAENDPLMDCNALASYLLKLGGELRFANYDEFNRFMSDGDSTLRL